MAKLDKDWVDAYFEFGVDVTNRRVFLDKDIDEESAGPVIKGLYLMETESHEKPIEMFIKSCGGDIYETLAIYDIMNTIKCPIHTFAFGKCMSAAPLLLANGEPGQRWVSPHASFMHHDWNGTIEGTGSQAAAELKHNEEIGQTWTHLLANHSTKDHRWWNHRAKKPADFYFSAEQALEWGLADSMWVEK